MFWILSEFSKLSQFCEERVTDFSGIRTWCKTWQDSIHFADFSPKRTAETDPISLVPSARLGNSKTNCWRPQFSTSFHPHRIKTRSVFDFRTITQINMNENNLKKQNAGAWTELPSTKEGIIENISHCPKPFQIALSPFHQPFVCFHLIKSTSFWYKIRQI